MVTATKTTPGRATAKAKPKHGKNKRADSKKVRIALADEDRFRKYQGKYLTGSTFISTMLDMWEAATDAERARYIRGRL